MKKTLFVILASVMASEASADTLPDISTGNGWLWLAQSDQTSGKIAALTYLQGLSSMHNFSGLAKECAPAPDGVTTGQIQAVVMDYLEDNPDKRHFPMVGIVHEAKKEAWGFFPVPADEPFCQR